MYATVRNNLFYYENACGNSIGGYGLATTKGGGSNGGGSSFHDVFVNNTLFDNGTQPGNDSEGTPSGDFQIQYQVGTSQDDYFENNVIYESAASPYSTSPNMWINSYVPANQAYPATLTAAGLTYPAPPATLNWNLYGSAAGYLEGTSILWSDVSSYTELLKLPDHQRRRRGCKLCECRSSLCRSRSLPSERLHLPRFADCWRWQHQPLVQRGLV
jgi:hypothetical protein